MRPAETEASAAGPSAAPRVASGSAAVGRAGTTSLRSGLGASAVGSTVEGRIAAMKPAREDIFRNANPATMTLDELVEREQRMGILPTPRSAAAESVIYSCCVVSTEAKESKRPAGTEALSDDEEEESEAASDAKTLKDRNWDNWKDDHEKGAGKLKTRY